MKLYTPKINALATVSEIKQKKVQKMKLIK